MLKTEIGYTTITYLRWEDYMRVLDFAWSRPGATGERVVCYALAFSHKLEEC